MREMKIMTKSNMSRRSFLKRTACTAVAAPLFIPGTALGRDGATPANDRIGFAGIGMGGQGRGDLGGFLGFGQVQTVAVCDVVGRHRQTAKSMVDQRYGNEDCAMYADFVPNTVDARSAEAKTETMAFEYSGQQHPHQRVNRQKLAFCVKNMLPTTWNRQVAHL